MSDESEAEASSQYRSGYGSSETVIVIESCTRFLTAMCQAIVFDNTSDHRWWIIISTHAFFSIILQFNKFLLTGLCKMSTLLTMMYQSQYELSWYYYCWYLKHYHWHLTCHQNHYCLVRSSGSCIKVGGAPCTTS